MDDLDDDEIALDLGDQDLSEVPDEVFECDQITELCLEKNNLEELPDQLGRLECLRDLYLRENRLRSLPASIGTCGTIQHASVNLVRTSGDAFVKMLIAVSYGTKTPLLSLLSLVVFPGECKELDTVYLEDNEIHDDGIPESFGDLASLKGLPLHRNKLTVAPLPIFRCEHLEELYFDNNSIVEIPEAIGNLIHLREVGLIANRLEKLPKAFGKLTKLEVLHAEENKLRKLPKAMGKCASLKRIYLQDNELEKLHSCLGRCEKLQAINCENNHLSGIAKRIANLPNLRILLLANNQLESLPFNPHTSAPGLRRLTLSGNKLKKEVMKLEMLGDIAE